jgi:hypothetical protein
VLRFCPDFLRQDLDVRLLLFQLLQALAALAAAGGAHGELQPATVVFQYHCWAQLLWPGRTGGGPAAAAAAAAGPGGPPAAQPAAGRAPAAPGPPPRPPLCHSLPQLTDLWRRRCITNLEYLLWLNQHAGRRWGDRAAHFIVPWVLDLSCAPQGGGRCAHQLPSGAPPPPGWRDLGVSKYRWAAGSGQRATVAPVARAAR